MKPHERREAARQGTAGQFPYYKLAKFDPTSYCWREHGGALPSESHARAIAATVPGTYRLCRVDESGRTDFKPFTVGGA
jgi:hypothetical protein